MINILEKINGKSLDDMEQKSLRTLDSITEEIYSAYGMGQKKGIGWLSALGAINFYMNVSAITNSIDLISEQASRVPLSVYDMKAKTFLKDGVANATPAKIFAKLKKPNFQETYARFMFSQMAFYMATGNCYWVAQALDKDAEPIQIFGAKPQDVTILSTGQTFPTAFLWNDGKKTLKFEIDIMTGRYLTTDSGFSYEISHSKHFNPKSNAGNLYGASFLAPIYDEMELNIAGIVHNKSLLQNGARPSGVVMVEEGLKDEAYENLKAEIRNFYQGSERAGNILILESGKYNFQQLSISPKDMDFVLMSDKVEKALYTRLKIPRPLLSEATMTYANFAEALYQLYILSVLPQFDLLLDDFSNFLLPRYKDAEFLDLRYDPQDIEALRSKQREDDVKTIGLGILTYNEARRKVGEEDLMEGGDVLTKAQSTGGSSQLALSDVKSIRNYCDEDRFKDIMRSQGFEEKSITEMAQKFYDD